MSSVSLYLFQLLFFLYHFTLDYILSCVPAPSSNAFTSVLFCPSLPNLLLLILLLRFLLLFHSCSSFRPLFQHPFGHSSYSVNPSLSPSLTFVPLSSSNLCRVSIFLRATAHPLTSCYDFPPSSIPSCSSAYLFLCPSLSPFYSILLLCPLPFFHFALFILRVPAPSCLHSSSLASHSPASSSFRCLLLLSFSLPTPQHTTLHRLLLDSPPTTSFLIPTPATPPPPPSNANRSQPCSSTHPPTALSLKYPFHLPVFHPYNYFNFPPFRKYPSLLCSSTLTSLLLSSSLPHFPSMTFRSLQIPQYLFRTVQASSHLLFS